MKIVPIDRITINRAERQRKELTNLEDLAESIRRHTESLPETGGLINPVVVTRDLVLVAGERRLTAVRDILKRSEIAVTFADELEPPRLRAIELEENIKREELPWQDYCLAIRELHLLKKSEFPNWTEGETGAVVGLDDAEINRRLKVANEIVTGNERVIEAPKYSVARGITERKIERENDSAVAELQSKLARKLDIPDRGTAPEQCSGSTPGRPTISPDPSPIVTASFLDWAPVYTGPRFNFIHCDFPYGINADKFAQGGAAAHGGYSDSKDYYWQLTQCLADNLDRLAGPSCHLMFWFSMEYYTETLAFFAAKTDFIINPFPLIWSKSDNVGILPDPSRGPRRVYETAFLGYRGDRKIVQAVANAYSAPSDRSIHMSVKPVPVLKHFFRMFVDTNSIVLDPTCGSGSALRAADAAGARHIVGLELNPEFAERARAEFTRDQKLRKASGDAS